MKGRPNAVINSPYRTEIEEFIREGKPFTYISNWLKEKDAYISAKTLSAYKKNDFNIQVIAHEKYNEKKSKERLDKASDEVVSDIEKIDLITALITPGIIEELSEKDQLYIFDKLLNTKYKILGVIDESVKVENNIQNNSVAVDEINDLFKEAEKGNDTSDD